MSTKKTISGLTRRNILDYIRMSGIMWAGALDESAFILRVWPNASSLPSYDSRFPDAISDIRQHREFNYDWGEDWVFTDDRFDLMGSDDETFLEFLAQMVHPVVRPSAVESARLVEELNGHLQRDGYELVPSGEISGYPIFAGAMIGATHEPSTALALSERTLLGDHRALQDHLGAIERDIKVDPAGAITSSKDLVETMYKLILDKKNIEYSNSKDDLPKLHYKVATALGLSVKSVPDSATGSAAAHRVLGSLANTVSGLAELRNNLGRGHGRTAASPALERHARLAFNAAVALTEFLYDTLQDREDTPN